MGNVEVKVSFNTKTWRHDEFFKQTLNSHVTIHSNLTRDNSQHTSTYPSRWDSFSIYSPAFQSCLSCTNLWPCQMTFSPSAVMHCNAAQRLCTFDISTCSRWHYQRQWFQYAAVVELYTQPDCIHAAMSSPPSIISNTCLSVRFMNWRTCIPRMVMHAVTRPHCRSSNISHPSFQTINIYRPSS